jgi:hypothetical protein
MMITNPILNELYKIVCEELEKTDKTQSEVRTELTKQRKSKRLRGNQLDPDSASAIQERVRLKFNLMNK